jgi:hypothetical protein
MLLLSLLGSRSPFWKLFCCPLLLVGCLWGLAVSLCLSPTDCSSAGCCCHGHGSCTLNSHDLLHRLFGLVGACSPSLALFFVLHEGCSCFGSCLGAVVPFWLVFGCPLLLSRCMSPADCSSADCWYALHGSCNLDVFFAVVFSCWALSSLFLGCLLYFSYRCLLLKLSGV